MLLSLFFRRSLLQPPAIVWQNLHDKLDLLRRKFDEMQSTPHHPIVKRGITSLRDVTFVIVTTRRKTNKYAEQTERLRDKGRALGLGGLLLYDNVGLARHFGHSFRVIPWLAVSDDEFEGKAQ